ncbi:MAG: hypothetical protein KJ042_12250, partial [Deltaproteobacteria bacterium]|nr:hypothetical protein [Deltaproteobacteria bacterium]
ALGVPGARDRGHASRRALHMSTVCPIEGAACVVVSAATDVPVIVPDAVTFVPLLFHDATNPTPTGCE